MNNEILQNDQTENSSDGQQSNSSSSEEKSDIVDIFDIEGNHLASGIVNYCSADIDRIKGMHSRKIDSILGTDFGPEVVHRNNLAIF